MPRRIPAFHAIVVVTVSASCRQVTQEQAIAQAHAFLQAQPDSSEYWLDSIRVESNDSAWFVSFRRRDVRNADGTITRTHPREAQFAVNRRHGKVQRVLLR